MCTLWLLSVAVVLASMLPSCTVAELCDPAKCDGFCFHYICMTDDTNCGGKRCDWTKNEYCIHDKCQLKAGNCDYVNRTIKNCIHQGENCGEGFCGYGNKCVKGVCIPIAKCDKQADNTSCGIRSKGKCKGGLCQESCKNTWDCAPCINGQCAEYKCGESSCL